jgi:hypothetical protein
MSTPCAPIRHPQPRALTQTAINVSLHSLAPPRPAPQLCYPHAAQDLLLLLTSLSRFFIEDRLGDTGSRHAAGEQSHVSLAD